jgi:hypothetical protein
MSLYFSRRRRTPVAQVGVSKFAYEWGQGVHKTSHSTPLCCLSRDFISGLWAAIMQPNAVYYDLILASIRWESQFPIQSFR